MSSKKPPKAVPVAQFLGGRGRRRLTYTAVTLVAAVLLIMADRSGLLLETGGDEARYNGRWCTVVRVVDGDTLELDVPDGDEPTTRVRLWGVDAPEMARRDPPRPAEPLAERATDRARALVQGERVHVTVEPHRLRGNYGRLLAFIELPDGRMLNEALIAEGLARADDRWSHRHVNRFAAVQRQARESGLGIWGP
jgi:micrococcal nuclease